jgi:hypothetical protein
VLHVAVMGLFGTASIFLSSSAPLNHCSFGLFLHSSERYLESLWLELHMAIVECSSWNVKHEGLDILQYMHGL